jgi:hypothetical protein
VQSRQRGGLPHRPTTRWGTNYYYLSYEKIPLLFQNGAHDGFHVAIGDTIQLSLTPGYLHEIGLVRRGHREPGGADQQADEARGSTRSRSCRSAC